MYKTILAIMFSYLLFTGQFIWFFTFGGAVVVWEILQWDDRMYQKRTKKRLAGN